MRLILVLALIFKPAQLLVAAEGDTKRPRDGYLKPIAIDADATKKVVDAVRRYREVLRSRDYRRFYRQCFHRVAKERQSEDVFVKQVESVAPKLELFFSDILTAYEKGLHQKEDFQ